MYSVMESYNYQQREFSEICYTAIHNEQQWLEVGRDRERGVISQAFLSFLMQGIIV